MKPLKLRKLIEKIGFDILKKNINSQNYYTKFLQKESILENFKSSKNIIKAFIPSFENAKYPVSFIPFNNSPLSKQKLLKNNANFIFIKPFFIKKAKVVKEITLSEEIITAQLCALISLSQEKDIN